MNAPVRRLSIVVAVLFASLLANWTLVAILLRISDHARRPLPEANAPSAVAEARTEVVRLR